MSEQQQDQDDPKPLPPDAPPAPPEGQGGVPSDTSTTPVCAREGDAAEEPAPEKPKPKFDKKGRRIFPSDEERCGKKKTALPKWKWRCQDFLDALSEKKVVRIAAEQIGISRRAPYRRRDVDPEFAQAWAELKTHVEREKADDLEEGFMHRLTHGWDEPIGPWREVAKFHPDGTPLVDANGNQVFETVPTGVKRVYDHRTAHRVLCALRAAKYSERVISTRMLQALGVEADVGTDKPMTEFL